MAGRRALISVYDKTGIVAFAQKLVALGFEIVSTGGTYTLLRDNGVKVVGISEVTGFPEIMDGRVKTLHPAVHGGLLAMRNNEQHMAQLAEHDIKPFDLVAVNLYPFQATISEPDVLFETAIENIDIGGPTMLRAAAKNHADVTVVVDAADYDEVLKQLDEHGATDRALRRRLAAKVFRHTAAYDALIAQYLTEQAGEELPERYTVTYEKMQDLRYGENPHQKAAFYRDPLAHEGNIATAKQLHGKELSYNNINDANAALQVLKEFTEPAAIVVKHMNPCGVGIGADVLEAFNKAHAADPTSIFGGIVAVNGLVNEEMAKQLHDIFLEIIIAPHFSDEALAVLQKKKNLRLLTAGYTNPQLPAEMLLTSVEGGLLVQDSDVQVLSDEQLKFVTERKPTEEELKQLLFAWKVVKHVKSNAIVLAKDNMTIGVGAGQMNRVGAARIAIEQAGELAQGSVLSSDAFFPMGDTVELAAEAGVSAIIQPGGSIKDEESIAKANEHGIAMVFTGVRHFKH